MDIVCFGADWHGHPTSTHHLLRRLAREHRVLWVNSLGMRTPVLTSGHDFKRLFSRAGRLLRHLLPRTTETDNLWIVDPVYIPLHGVGMAQRFNRKAMASQLQFALRHLGMSEPVVLTALPNSVELIPALSPRAVVYYCLDDFTRMPGVDVDVISQQEQELARLADMILVSGEHLRGHLEGRGTPVLSLPHGVDVERFAAASAADPILASVPGPRIGFFGALDHWLDLELIANVAKARPDWHFPIVGPTRIPLDMWDGIPNIHILGAVPYASIPGVAFGLDIGLLPFEVNDFTKAINPLKLREYFAAGTPAISTSLPEVAPYQPLVQMADTVEETIAAIEAMLAAPPTREALLAAVAAESWEARANDVLTWLDDCLHGRAPQQRAG